MLPNPFNPFVTHKDTTDPVQNMMVATMKEFTTLLDGGVLGDPVIVGTYTIIPVMITTFGVGVGGGSVMGEALGGGGGGGAIPVALIVVGPNGVEVKLMSSDAVGRAADSVTRMAHDLSVKHRAGGAALKGTTLSTGQATTVSADPGTDTVVTTATVATEG